MTGTPHPRPGATYIRDNAGLWAEAKARYLAGDFPPYASPAWRLLELDDPRRLAAVLADAEAWRHHTAREQWLAQQRDDTAPVRGVHGQQLTPTPDWPPIRVPGAPGRFLQCDGRTAA